MKKSFDFIFSTRLMGVLILFFAFAMAVATFVENDYGTQTSKALIYNAWWFEAIMALLVINFIGNIFRYRLFRKEKWPVLLFHIAFIVILLGAFISRYFGFEGVMPIREGSSSDTILSDITYIQATVDNGKEKKDYEKEVLFSKLQNNHVKIRRHFKEVPFSIECKQYTPNAKEVFKTSDKGKEHLHIVFTSEEGRRDVYIADKEIIQVGNHFVSLNNPMDGILNFVKKDGVLYFQPIENGAFMVMQTQAITNVYKDSLQPAEFLKLYTFPTSQFVIPENLVKGEKKIEPALKNEKGNYPFDQLVLKVTSGTETKEINVKGAKNEISESSKISLNGLNFNINYGSKAIKTPFSIQLKDFQIERYPGSSSPSSFASEVKVMDKDKSFDYRIFMNHVLDYKGYRFFQSSYQPDEMGTILSVNHDYWGTLITYIGYFLMGLGMFFTLFWKGSRFQDLVGKLNKLDKKVGMIVLFLSFSIFASAQSSTSDSTNQSKDPSEHYHTRAVQKYIVSKEHADKFGRLLVQGQGRIKPINTYALEAMRKVYKKDTFEGLTAEQVILSAQIDPYYWGEQYLIHVKQNALGSKMSSDLDVKDGNTAAANFFKTGDYYFSQLIQEVSMKKNSDRNATDKEVVNLDERVNVFISILNGDLLKIYPKKGDKDNKWFAGNDNTAFVAQDTMILKMHQMYLQSLVQAIETNDYSEADKFLGYIQDYQNEFGADIIPAAKKVDLEIQYNKWEIFKKLMMYYMLVGFAFLLFAFIDLFGRKNMIIKVLIFLSTVLAVVGLIVHGLGLWVRSYVSEHAPWSDGYEAVLFMAFVIVLIGLIFSFKRSKFILAVSIVFAALLLGIAHGSTMNPEITNLVPVLKSYWLKIHVAVITASYMFLGLGSFLSLLVLLFYILRNKSNANKLNKTIDELTYINEISLIVGLFALSIGTFLGGVWANESWGRYWSWDPKEVWSLISMMVYLFVLHMRLIPGLRGKFTFNIVSLFAISTLIMTFFGVNFYLSGMHSYASGDPVPVPLWVYLASLFLILFAVFSYLRYKQFEKNN